MLPPGMSDRAETRRRYLQIWNGERELDDLDSLVTPGYIGHMGSRDRGVERLKEDIAAYRRGAPSVRFHVEHEFGDADYVASRVVARGKDAEGRPVSARGLNISRFESVLLAEEWAEWEPLVPLE